MHSIPQGEATLRLRVPADSQDLHGRVPAGWLLAQIDQAAMLAGERLTQGPVAAVSFNPFQLQVPVYVGDVLSLYAECLRKGQKSLVLKVLVLAERQDGESLVISEVIMTYVAVDAQGKSRMIA